MKCSTNGLSQPSEHQIAPNFALVFHGGEHQKRNVVTLHQIERGELKMGSYIDAHSVQEMVADCTSPTDDVEGFQLLPDNVLLDNGTLLAWYTKAKRNVLHMRYQRTNSHQMVNYPALLYIANKESRSVQVFALSQSVRPTLNTTLFHAPFFNLNGAGGLCLGSATLPPTLFVQTIADIESAFVDANGTHTNHNQTLSKVASDQHGSLAKFWKYKAKSQERVRVSELQPYKRLNEVLNDYL